MGKGGLVVFYPSKWVVRKDGLGGFGIIRATVSNFGPPTMYVYWGTQDGKEFLTVEKFSDLMYVSDAEVENAGGS